MHKACAIQNTEFNLNLFILTLQAKLFLLRDLNSPKQCNTGPQKRDNLNPIINQVRSDSKNSAENHMTYKVTHYDAADAVSKQKSASRDNTNLGWQLKRTCQLCISVDAPK